MRRLAACDKLCKQDLINFYSMCPCGFFCKDCLMMEINEWGVLRGIRNHIFWHTPLAKIYYSDKLSLYVVQSGKGCE